MIFSAVIQCLAVLLLVDMVINIQMSRKIQKAVRENLKRRQEKNEEVTVIDWKYNKLS
ncbi:MULTISPECIES: hypothetical protein [Bacillus cereus group]|uniref:Uncharacterized protein n=1 Tax=Bacillus thuringiensis Bt18247 TaxID=1423143 RepID=A0A9W3XC77_BACTU|nr:hypothetical protein [Bacillus thuringiensis]AOM14616.1 hypothetical protein BTI247_62860 [Bacillus thuringiensis Bt18247]